MKTEVPTFFVLAVPQLSIAVVPLKCFSSPSFSEVSALKQFFNTEKPQDRNWEFFCMLFIRHENLVPLGVPIKFTSHLRVPGNVVMSSRRFDCLGNETKKSQCAENVHAV